MEKNLPANAGDAGDAGLFPGLERSPGVTKYYKIVAFFFGVFNAE